MKVKTTVPATVPAIVPAILLIILACPASGILNTGAIQGAVTDSLSGKSLSGVTITVEPEGRTSKSGGDGAFHLFDLPQGGYRLTFRKRGYYDFERPKIPVFSDRITRLDIRMIPEPPKPPPEPVPPETLRVAHRSQVELESDDILNFPSVRLEEILAYQNGVGYNINWKTGAGLSVRGGDVDETAVLIDNLSHGNRLTNVPFLKLNRSALQSASIQKGGFDAGFGDLRAGMVQLVTRNGPRDRYSVGIDFAVGQPGRKHFGPHAYDRNGTIWETFAGEQTAFDGITADVVNNPDHPDRFGRQWW
ncbi:carboxypeptidase regulatory-like domain-containing protein, partial [candidate division KSB1 bacterium]